MFAHQVIEDIKYLNQKYTDSPNNAPNGMKNMLNVADSYSNGINVSQKFHLGDATSILGLNKMSINTPVFLGEHCEKVRLPYENIWCEWTHTSGNIPKSAILVISITHKIWLTFSFFYHSGMKLWTIPIMNSYVFVGGYTGQNKIDFDRLVTIKGDIKPKPGKTEGLIGNIITTYCVDVSEEEREWTDNLAGCHTDLLQSSIMLLNCKNIQTEKIPAPAELNKKRVKSGKQPIFDYHVLNLVLPSNKKRGYQEQSMPLSHNRVHLCRGHFKEYTKEHPLFGRHTGLYWWEPSVRGQNRDGIVMKDYNVTPQPPGI